MLDKKQLRERNKYMFIIRAMNVIFRRRLFQIAIVPQMPDRNISQESSKGLFHLGTTVNIIRFPSLNCWVPFVGCRCGGRGSNKETGAVSAPA